MGVVIAYITKNLAILIGVIEAILKAVAGIVSLTPTKSDDVVVAKVDEIFSKIKAFFYKVSDNAAN